MATTQIYDGSLQGLGSSINYQPNQAAYDSWGNPINIANGAWGQPANQWIQCYRCFQSYMVGGLYYCMGPIPGMQAAVETVAKKIKKVLPKGFSTGSRKLEMLPPDLRKLADEVLIDKFA